MPKGRRKDEVRGPSKRISSDEGTFQANGQANPPVRWSLRVAVLVCKTRTRSTCQHSACPLPRQYGGGDFM
eukprot:1156688-Pelagomonas_calceolata.AAC.2